MLYYSYNIQKNEAIKMMEKTQVNELEKEASAHRTDDST